MRRLWAHVIIAATALVTVFALMPTLIQKYSSNSEHSVSRQFTFQLSEREKDDEETEVAALTENSAKEMAKVMEQRLINFGVTSYNITTTGNDIITAAFKADEDQYTQIVTYLGFSGSFALMNNQNDVVTGDKFRNGDAYLKNVSVNEYPTVILPIKTDYTEWETLVKGAIDNPEQEEAQSEEEEAKSVARIYMIYNYQTGDTYQTLTETNKLNEKTFLTFECDPADETGLYYDENKNALSKVCGYQDSNGNGVADSNEVKAAFNQADFLLNLFNSTSLDYEVKCIKGLTDDTKIWVDPTVESVVSQGKIVWNSTLTATVAAIVIASLLLFVFYRLGTLSVMTASIAATFGAFLFMILAGLEYNMLAVAGLVMVAALGIVSGIIYLNKLKEDAYRGHTLKKANTEASKKSLLPIIDIHVVTIIIGLMTYLLGGSALHSFGSILTFGSVVSVLINTLGLKGMMWLSTNATGLIGKYEVFGIDSNNVPNHMAEEKQRYYGPYADKDLTVKKKPVSIISGAVFAVALIGIILSASLMGGNLIKPAASKSVSNELYVQNKIKVEDDDSKSKLDEYTLDSEILSKIEVQDSKTQEYKALKEYVASTSYDSFVVTESKTFESTTTNYSTTYYVVKLNETIASTRMAKLASEDVSLARPISEIIDEFESDPSFFSGSVSNVISFKTQETVIPNASPDWTKVTLATSIGILILTVYFMIRYRLTRGLTTIVFSVGSGAVTLGLLALMSVIGLNVPVSAVVALPIVSIFSYYLMVLLMNRERELVLDDKTRDVSKEHREELAKSALGMAFAPMLAVSALVAYLFIDMFGFGVASQSYMYLAAILGSIVALATITVLFVPLASLLVKWFSGIKIEFKPRREHKGKKATVKKSAEPEEAIFIGIND